MELNKLNEPDLLNDLMTQLLMTVLISNPSNPMNPTNPMNPSNPSNPINSREVGVWFEKRNEKCPWYKNCHCLDILVRK